jgi:cyclic di-GMP phosphodiesterase Gmr
VTAQRRGSYGWGLAAALHPDDLLRAFVQASDVLICVVDGDGRILFANPALQLFTGLRADELEGRRFWEVYVVPEHVALARDAVERAMATGVAQPQEGDWLAGDGERRRVSMRITVLHDEEGCPFAIGCIAVDVTSDRLREAQLHVRAQTDLLTGLANRGALFEALQVHLEDGAGCALLFCDLDQFKTVNDEHGHAVGDALLIEVAERLSLYTGPDDLVARFGGDEFVIMCPRRDEHDLLALAEQVTACVAAPYPGPLGPLQIGVSVGVAVGRPGETADELISRADRAMYGVKTRRHRRGLRPRRAGDHA